MFRSVAVVSDIRFERYALAKVFWRWLQYAQVASTTGNDTERDYNDTQEANISQIVHTHEMLRRGKRQSHYPVQF